MGIQFKNVSFNYKNQLDILYPALKNINLTINNNDEFIVILGKTGSGKSTMLEHMNALLLPTTGEININGYKLPSRKIKDLSHIRKQVGLVFQFPEYQLFEETVLKDIAFGPKNFIKMKKNAIEIAKNTSKLLNISENLLDKSPFKISGGEMRKVAIAGIMAMDPKILILDEPTRGLDPKTTDEIINLLYYINTNKHKTVIVVTHDIDIAIKIAKRIVVVNDGKIVFDDTKDNFLLINDYKAYGLYDPEIRRLTKYLSKTLKINLNGVNDKEKLLNRIKEVYR